MFILMSQTLTSSWIDKTLKWTAFENKTSFLLPEEKGLKGKDKFFLLERMRGEEVGGGNEGLSL